MPQTKSYYLLFVLGELPATVTIKPKPLPTSNPEPSKVPDPKNKPAQSKPTKTETAPETPQEAVTISFEHLPESERQRLHFKNLSIKVGDIKSKIKDLTNLHEKVRWAEANPTNEKVPAMESMAKTEFQSIIIDICCSIFSDKTNGFKNTSNQNALGMDDSRLGLKEHIEKFILGNLSADSASIERVLDIFINRGSKITDPILLYLFRKHYCLGIGKN